MKVVRLIPEKTGEICEIFPDMTISELQAVPGPKLPRCEEFDVHIKSFIIVFKKKS